MSLHPWRHCHDPDWTFSSSTGGKPAASQCCSLLGAAAWVARGVPDAAAGDVGLPSLTEEACWPCIVLAWAVAQGESLRGIIMSLSALPRHSFTSFGRDLPSTCRPSNAHGWGYIGSASWRFGHLLRRMETAVTRRPFIAAVCSWWHLLTWLCRLVRTVVGVCVSPSCREIVRVRVSLLQGDCTCTSKLFMSNDEMKHKIFLHFLKKNWT